MQEQGSLLMTDSKISFPDFDNPPVIEVVCGVHFKSINTLLAPHFGLLWEKYKDEYPVCQEVAPLAPAIERFDKDRGIGFDFQETPPLPRIWFKHQLESGIIQVQRDRFLHNWRKIRPDDEYPRYPVVIELFRNRLSRFQEFLQENDFGEIKPLQYEMTYVNHICEGEGWNGLSEIGNILRDFAFVKDNNRFLPEPEKIHWRTSFLLPDRTGRMHVTVRNVIRKDNDKPIIVLDLTVRGIGEIKMDAWFDLARKWIVCGFADLTGNNIQNNIWRRRN
jgi:uncharacterized protein (TIGR04255 family)